MPQYVEVNGQNIEFPDGMAPAEIEAAITKNRMAITPEKKSFTQQIAQGAGNIAAGAVRGAGSIGATLLTPLDAAARAMGVQNDFIGRTDRREAMDGGLQDLGADPESLLYKGGKLAAEVAGTAGVGGALAKPVLALSASKGVISPAAFGIAKALQTGGFRVGPLTGATGLATRALGGAAVGGASAGLVDPEGAGVGAAIGGALPLAAQGIGKASSMIRNGITGGGVNPEVAQLAQRAKELGIDIPADRLVNSRPLNAVASSLNYIPMSGRAATEDAMNSQLNRALSRTFGEDSSNVTMALRNAEKNLGGKFQEVLKNNVVDIDEAFFKEMAAINNTAVKELGDDAYRAIGSQVDEIVSKGASGQIDGQAAYNIKRTLDRMGQENTPAAWHATELKKSLMGALDRSIGPEKAAAFAKTRQQYGNMLALEKLAKNGAEGELSVARIANMKNINNEPLQELADISAQFVKAREGQHGAAQRVSLGALAGVLGGWAGGPIGAAISAGGVMGGGRAANMALNSDALKRYLLRQPGLLAEPETLGLLTKGVYRTAPLLGAPQSQ